jgi:hypothetical protein
MNDSNTDNPQLDDKYEVLDDGTMVPGRFQAPNNISNVHITHSEILDQSVTTDVNDKDGDPNDSDDTLNFSVVNPSNEATQNLINSMQSMNPFMKP